MVAAVDQRALIPYAPWLPMEPQGSALVQQRAAGLGIERRRPGFPGPWEHPAEPRPLRRHPVRAAVPGTFSSYNAWGEAQAQVPKGRLVDLYV